MMERLSRYWLEPLPAVRAWLLFRAFLVLFALDLFADHPAPGWRYGTAGFNVAHFAILDALPIPSSVVYVGALVALGLTAFVTALAARPPRALVLAIAVGYLWSWSCSMHDSYQHHYLLSLVWLAFATFPALSSRDLFGTPAALARAAAPSTKDAASKGARATPAPRTVDAALPHGLVPRASAFGLVMVWTTAAVVYFYTAIAKTEPGWIDGAALRNLTRDGATIPSAVRAFAWLGLEGEAMWSTLGHATVALQVACCLGYLLAPVRDRAEGSLRRALDAGAWFVLGLALSFHAGAEAMGLEIGWFSGYMVLLALVTFLPARWLSAAALALTWPVRARGDAPAPGPIPAALLAFVAATGLVAAGLDADLPGIATVTTLAAVGLMAGAVAALVRQRGTRLVQRTAISLGLAALALALAMRATDTRYDHWRFAGGDFRRRGEWQRALDAYQHANRHAPPGRSRRDRIDEMRARIAEDGPRRPDRP